MPDQPDETSDERLLNDLSAREDELVHAALWGDELMCSELDVDELAASNDPDHVVRAELLRELLLGRRGDLDPRGIRLTGARIINTLDLDGVHATAALWLGDCVFDEPIEAFYSTLPSLIIGGGRIAGLHAPGACVDSDLFLVDLLITSTSKSGGVNVAGARIAGNLTLKKATITNTSGTAINAEGIHVGGDVLIRNGVRITGAGENGALRLIGAHINGDLEIEDLEVTSTGGSALLANRIRVDGSMFLRERVRFTGDSAVYLNGARIGAYFGGRGDGVDIQIATGSGPILDLEEMQVGTTLALPPDLICPASGEGDTCAHPQQVNLEYLSYAALTPGMGWRRWLHVVRCHTPTYHASPYQQLAAVERAAGHDGNARQILIAQQHDLRRRAPNALGGSLTLFFHRVWGLLAGYGYRGRRTAAALLLALVLAGTLGWWAGQVVTRPGHHAAERVAPAGTPATAPGVPCSFIELVGLGLDRGLPLGLTGLRARCDLDTTARKGQAFTAAIWGVQLAVWGLATLALAGFTNLVRKTN